MKIPEEQKKEIFDGMADMLDPDATEAIEEMKEIEGRDLIYQGITKDMRGKQILPGVKYFYSTTTTRRVNHKQKMGRIIDDAPNQAEMVERLGEYLAKYAKDPNAVRETIPAVYRAARIEKSDN